MELIIRERQSGKTTELINISFTTKGVIICCNQRAKQHILNMATKAHKEVPPPLTYQEFLSTPNVDIKSILIDDCEHFLEYITKTRVQAVSFSATTKTKG